MLVGQALRHPRFSSDMNLFFVIYQAQALRQIFMLVVQALQQFSHTELNLLSREDVSALLRLLSLAEQILNWDFSHFHILFT